MCRTRAASTKAIGAWLCSDGCLSTGNAQSIGDARPLVKQAVEFKKRSLAPAVSAVRALAASIVSRKVLPLFFPPCEGGIEGGCSIAKEPPPGPAWQGGKQEAYPTNEGRPRVGAHPSSVKVQSGQRAVFDVSTSGGPRL